MRQRTDASGPRARPLLQRGGGDEARTQTLGAADTESAVRDLFVAEYDRVVRLAAHIVLSTSLAEDIAQEAFVRLLLKSRDSPQVVTRRYLSTIVVNMARDALRWNKRTARIVSRLAATGPHAYADSYPNPDLAAALANLPPRRRVCVVLRYYYETSVAETAAIMGISEGAVKSQTSRALQQLKLQMQPKSPAADSSSNPPPFISEEYR